MSECVANGVMARQENLTRKICSGKFIAASDRPPGIPACPDHTEKRILV